MGSVAWGVSAHMVSAYDRYAPLQPGIQWTNCTISTPSNGSITLPANYSCGTFDVPLDYANETAGKATLAVIKLAASPKKRRLGSIFFNQGDS